MGFFIVLLFGSIEQNKLTAQTVWMPHSGNPVMDFGPSGSWDEGALFLPFVIKDGDTLKMWYNGSGNLAAGIGYAWSVDGANWTRVRGQGSGGSVFDASMDGAILAGVIFPTVVKVDCTFHM
ncbi:MAG: hypothetical protein IIA49_11425, partial [Bacteroidetes bacterium]|nr:hypothetical protein [Bacteroidota bacterium]